MPAFEYKALNARGKEEKGILEGDSPRSIRQQLRERQLTPLEVVEVKESGARGGGLRTSRSHLKSIDLAMITRQLATLLQAGTPLEESLAAIAGQASKKNVERIVLGVRGKVVEGYSFAESLGQFPGAFPELYRATVAAGENSGHLDKVLDRLAEYTEDYQAIQQKMTTALIYPVMLTGIAILIVSGLLGYVVPKVVGVFDNLGQELPALTKGLIAVSDVVKASGLYVAILLAVGALVFSRLYKRPGFRRRVDRALLRLPVFGRLIRGKNTAAFTRTLSILFGSGVSILDALKNSAAVVSNLPMRDAIEETIDRVREGGSLSGSLKRSGLFPPMVLYLISSGENSGRLGEMLERAAEQQENETSNTISAAISLFEPALILTMGIAVFVIVLAILLPIFELNQMVG